MDCHVTAIVTAPFAAHQTPTLENGHLVVPTKPGLGLAFDQAALKRYQVG